MDKKTHFDLSPQLAEFHTSEIAKQTAGNRPKETELNIRSLESNLLDLSNQAFTESTREEVIDMYVSDRLFVEKTFQNIEQYEKNIETMDFSELVEHLQIFTNTINFIKNIHVILEREQTMHNQTYTEHCKKYFFLDKILLLQEIQKQIFSELKKRLKENPNLYKSLIQQIHKQKRYIEDSILDELFGINKKDKINKPKKSPFATFTPYELEKQIHRDTLQLIQTSYQHIKYLYQQGIIDINKPLYDIGAGFGRISLYGALLGQSEIYAIEKNGYRLTQLLKGKRRMRLPNINLFQGDCLKYKYQKPGQYIAYSPFPAVGKDADNFFKKLESSDTPKPITVIWIGQITYDIKDFKNWKIKDLTGKSAVKITILELER